MNQPADPRVTVAFDHHTAEWVEDPYTLYQELRQHKPLAYSPAHGGFWILSRYEDVKGALQDWARFSSAHAGRIAIPHTRPSDNIPGIPIEADPPRHTQYRSAIVGHFLRSSVVRFEPELTAYAHQLIDAFIEAGRCDLVGQYATPLLARSLALFLELPFEDMARIEQWAHAVFGNRTRDPEGARSAQQELAQYIRQQMRTRQDNPGDDLFSQLVKLRVDGQPLSENELVGYGRIVLLAGREAVIDAIGNSLWYLAHNPAARQQLLEHPQLMNTAVEEFLRYLSPIQLLGRVATTDITLHGQTIKAGESVAMLYGSANRDEAQFSQADQCQLDRKPNAHLAFGSGPHACIGASLARLDLRVALAVFLERIPQFGLIEDHPPQRKLNGDARGFTRLPIQF